MAIRVPSDREGKRRFTVWVSIDALRRSSQHAMYRLRNLASAVEVMNDPDRTHEGIRTDASGERRRGWVYVGKPTVIRSVDRNEYPLADENLFLVFLLENRVVHDWGEERRNPGNPEEPLSTETRFGELIWRKT